MVTISFDLGNYEFEMLAQLKDADPDAQDKSYNEYARGLLEDMIYIARKRAKDAGLSV